MGELKLYKALEEALGSQKAKEVTEALLEIVEHGRKELKSELKEELLKELATKYDLQLTEQSLRALIEQVRGELETQIQQVKGELQVQIEQVKGELQTQIEQVRNEIQQVKADLLKWLIVLFIGQATFIVGLVFTLAKIFKG